MVKFPKLTELYTDLPGFPNLNTIEKPKQHVPIDYDAEKDSQKKQQRQDSEKNNQGDNASNKSSSESR